MFSLLATFVATYYAAAIVQVVAHRLFGHIDRLRPVFESHTVGHHRAYRTDALLLDCWVAAERHVIWYFVPLFAPMILAVISSRRGWCSLHTCSGSASLFGGTSSYISNTTSVARPSNVFGGSSTNGTCTLFTTCECIGTTQLLNSGSIIYSAH